MRSLSRSTLTSLPYHGQMRKIWLEYEMNPMRHVVPTTLDVSYARVATIVPDVVPVDHR